MNLRNELRKKSTEGTDELAVQELINKITSKLHERAKQQEFYLMIDSSDIKDRRVFYKLIQYFRQEGLFVRSKINIGDTLLEFSW